MAAAVGGLLASALSLVPQAGQAGEPCDKCKPKQASWDWKANGYALAASAEDALKGSLEKAKAEGCGRAEAFLKPRKLSCSFGCSGGEVETTCKQSKEPLCTTGTFQQDAGMWKFVCRKMAKKGQQIDCSDERAAKEPGYAMCDVKVRMLKQRPCHDPACK